MKLRIVTLAVLALAAFGISYLAGTGTVLSLSQERKASVQDSTPIQIGAMTERQKEHSKLYKKYGRDEKIVDLLRRQTGEIDLFRLPPLPAELGSAPKPTVQEMLQQVACSADAVVVGVPKRKTSQLTDTQDFVFTDYEVEVHQVLRNAGSQAIQEYGEITITRPGGVVLINGRKVRAIDETMPLLSLDKSYIFFLSLVPQTGAYRAVESGATYYLKGEQLQKFSYDNEDRLTRGYTTTSFINEIRDIAVQGCGGQTGGVR
jgi:hypothetical protein